MAIDEQKEALLADYLDGTLDEEDLAEVERLLKQDVELAAEMKDADKLVRMLNELPDQSPPADLLSNVLAATIEKKGFFSLVKEFFTFRRQAPFAAIAAGAIACITLVVILTVPGVDVQKGKVAPGTFEIDDTAMIVPAPAAPAKPSVISKLTGKKAEKAELKEEVADLEQPVYMSAADKSGLKDTYKDRIDTLSSKTEATGETAKLSKNLESKPAGVGRSDANFALPPEKKKPASKERLVDIAGKGKSKKSMDMDRADVVRNEVRTAIVDEKALPAKASSRAKRSTVSKRLTEEPRLRAGGQGGITMTPISAGGGSKGALGLDEGPMLGAAPYPDEDELAKGEAQSTVLGIRNRFKGTNSGIEKFQTVLITNNAKFSALWKKLYSVAMPAPPVPKVDFSRSMVLGIFLGNKPTGGHQVKITGVRLFEEKLIVSAHVTQPSPKKSHSFNVTRPFSLVIVEKPEFLKAGQILPVEFIYE